MDTYPLNDLKIAKRSQTCHLFSPDVVDFHQNDAADASDIMYWQEKHFQDIRLVEDGDSGNIQCETSANTYTFRTSLAHSMVEFLGKRTYVNAYGQSEISEMV